MLNTVTISVEEYDSLREIKKDLNNKINEGFEKLENKKLEKAFERIRELNADLQELRIFKNIIRKQVLKSWLLKLLLFDKYFTPIYFDSFYKEENVN